MHQLHSRAASPGALALLGALRPLAPSLVPELRLWLLPSSSPLWHATSPEALGWPCWAFAWPGGQALARFLLDRPEVARGRRVLAFGAGGGVEALAAWRAGRWTRTCSWWGRPATSRRCRIQSLQDRPGSGDDPGS
jgi:predicted nicotinamide N-methyase